MPLVYPDFPPEQNDAFVCGLVLDEMVSPVAKRSYSEILLGSDYQEDNADCKTNAAQKMSNISHPHENDVLMGRGGKNNQWYGNEKLRSIARERCREYQLATKKEKSLISRELVKRVRRMKPSGR